MSNKQVTLEGKKILNWLIFLEWLPKIMLYKNLRNYLWCDDSWCDDISSHMTDDVIRNCPMRNGDFFLNKNWATFQENANILSVWRKKNTSINLS